VSDALRTNYLEDFGRETHHISNGMPPVAPSGDLAHLRALGLEAGGYFLYIGRLVPEKACNELVEAFRGVTGDVRLAIVGDAAHTNEFVSDLKTAAAADPRITFTGPLYGPEKATVFANARAFVLPSHLEGLPLALLEASAYRLPVVVSDIPPHLEALVESGPGRRLFPVGDVAALTADLQRVVDHLDDEKAGAELSGKSVESRYDWNDIADATLEVYASVISRDRSRLRWLKRKAR
jgi:glycosyltransferase involved in cell wall biosynthesis